MTSKKTQKLTNLVNKLAELLMSCALCAEKIRATLLAEHGGGSSPNSGRSIDSPLMGLAGANHGPRVDHSTLSLSWNGKTCYLGYTVLFRLADRLSRRPNHYITPELLLRDVWHGDVRSAVTIRSTVRHLRRRLKNAGMNDLAAAIRGQGGRYGLILQDGR